MAKVSEASWLKVILINVFILLLLLLLLEMAIRIIYPGLHPVGEDSSLYLEGEDSYSYMPQASGYSHGALFEIDELGHRKSSLYTKGNAKILIIGDSVSVGAGVEADKIFPALLDKSLPKYSIVNSSVSGYSLRDYVLSLKRELNRDKYQGVIVGLCLNDYSSTGQKGIIDKIKKKQNKTCEDYKSRYPDTVVRWLRCFNDFYFDFNKYANRYYMTSLWLKSLLTDSQKNYYLHDLKFFQTADATGQLATEFELLKNFAHQHGAWIKFLVFPYEYQLRQKPLDFTPQQKILAAGKRAGVEMYDFTGLIQNTENPGEQFLYLDPMHFSNSGHALVAEAIKQKLLEATR